MELPEIDVDAEIARRGGIYIYPETASAAVMARVEWAYTRVNDVSLFAQMELGMASESTNLMWDVINNNTLGGLSITSKQNGQTFDFFGINVGTIFVVFDTFARLLSHPSTFTQIGNASVEDAERAYAPHLSPKRSLEEYTYIEPIDQVRAVYSRGLALISLEFLAWHEIAHLRNGHADWHQKKYGLAFEEAISFNDDGASKIEEQACEFDADCSAIQWTINRLFAISHEFATAGKTPTTAGEYAEYLIYQSPESLTEAVVYAVYIMFRLFDSAVYDPVGQHKRSHPQPPVRQHIIQSQIITLFDNNPYYQIGGAECAKQTMSVITNAEKDYASVQQIKPDASRYLSLYEPRNNRHLKIHKWRLHKAWSRIYPELLKYKRHGNLAKSNLSEQIIIPYSPDYDFGDQCV